MAHLTRIRIALLAALCLAAITAAFWLVRPALLNENAIRASLVQNLRSWTGATVTIGGPVELGYFPRLIMQIGDVRLDGITRLPAVREASARQVEVRLGLWSLVSGTPIVDRLTLIGARIEAGTGAHAPAGGSGHNEAPVLMRILDGSPFGEIALEQGVISVTGPETAEEFKDVTAKINLRGSNGALSSRATFTWRDQEVAIRHEGGIPEKVANALKMPVMVSIDGELARAEIEGTATVASGLSIIGNLDLQIANLPRFAKWTGVLVPDDQNRGAFSATGTFHWTGHRIGFDEGTFALDGNKALGALALDFGGPRPEIEGTLALQRLDLTQYFKSPQKAKPAPDTPSKDAGAQTVDMDFPLLHHVNVDLRISTTELIAPPLKVGQSALSVTLNSGRLAADIAIFDLCGGSGNGRLEFDATVPDSAFRLTANLGGVAAKSCIEIFTARSPLTGTADVVADLTSKGRTAHQLLESLRGKASVSMGAGQMEANIAKLSANLRNGQISGWEGARGGATAFQALKGDFFLRPAGAYTDSFKMNLGTSDLTAEGTIDLLKRTFDLRLTESKLPPAKEAPASETPVQKPASTIVIKGPWSDPSFSLEPAKSSARMTPSPASPQFVWRRDF